MDLSLLFLLAAAAIAVAAFGPDRAALAAENEIVFPPNSGVFNVVTDGGVDNTGRTDVTDKLQQIINDGTRATQRRLQIIYFPNGTYRVSGMLAMKIDKSRTETSHSHGPWLIGQSRDGVIIRLADGTWRKPASDLTGTDERGRPPHEIEKQVVLSAGDCTNTTFNKIIRNFTINIGRDNPGAIGVQYNTSNTGTMSDVAIVSEDGQGVAGLALAGVENGPGQIRNITIRGFDIGLYGVSGYVIASSDITIEGARRFGVINHGIIAGEDFTIDMAGKGPAIVAGSRGAVALIGAKITGRGGPAAIQSDGGMLYLRDIETSGYDAAMTGQGTTIAEFAAGPPVGLFHNTGQALRLPIKKAPAVPYELDFSKWANPMDYGAVGDDKADDTEAVQNALSDPGKTHVVFPYGKVFRIRGPLTLGPDVVRVVGTQGLMRYDVDDDAKLIIGDGNAPTVVIEGFTTCPPIHVRTDRTVILDSVRSKADQPQMPKPPPGQPKIMPPLKYCTVGFYLEGGGDVFIDNTGTTFVVNNPAQRVWLRHYNSELGQESHNQVVPVEVKAGRVWMLGWKSENLVQRVRVHPGAAMELTGFNNYEVGVKREKDGNWPIFEIIDGQFSCNLLTQRGSKLNKNLVWETRHGEKRVLTYEDGPEGRHCSLYTGYEPAAAESLREGR